MGASCARVCPTDELCEGACVYAKDDSPIRIGDLQRYALDELQRSGEQLFKPGAPTGKTVAIVGGGPAGLSVARDLRLVGHAVTIFDAHDALGGLNTYGIVPFRLSTDVALWEADQVVQLGVDVRTGVRVGDDVSVESLLADFDALVIACGMGGVEARDSRRGPSRRVGCAGFHRARQRRRRSVNSAIALQSSALGTPRSTRSLVRSASGAKRVTDVLSARRRADDRL